MIINDSEQTASAQTCKTEAAYAQAEEIRRLFRNKYSRLSTVVADVEHAALETLLERKDQSW